MNFERRKNIIDFLNKAENRYPVNEWILNDVEFWPIIRICVFFNEYHRDDNLADSKLKTFLKAFFKLLGFAYLYGLYNIIKLKFNKVDFLFAGFESHRAILEMTSFNKYFDPIMDEIELRNKKSMLFEYLPNSPSTAKRMYKKERVKNIHNLIYYFKVRSSEIKFEDFVL
ncbi:MAG: hypothetical protein V7767_05165, partial [Leeuwenhoekiella sp.]